MITILKNTAPLPTLSVMPAVDTTLQQPQSLAVAMPTADEPPQDPMLDFFVSPMDLNERKRLIDNALTSSQAFKQALREIEGLPKDQALPALRALETKYGLHTLSADHTTVLFYAYKGHGSFADMTRLYETSPNQDFKNSDVIREFYIVALNKTKRLGDSLRVSESYLADGFVNGEVLAGMGKAYRELARKNSNARTELERSYDYYLQGYLVDFEYYPGVNAVYNLIELGRKDEAEKLAQMVFFSTLRSGGKSSTDYWCLTTMMELAVITRSATEIRDMLPRVLNAAKADWEIDATLTQVKMLRSLRHNAGEDVSLMDFVIAEMEKRAKSINEPAVATNPEVMATLKSATRQDPVTQAILSKGFSYEGLSSHYIGGNLPFGGQLRDHVINRRDLQAATEVLKHLGLNGTTDFELWDARVNDYVADKLQLADPQTGERWLENLHSNRHRYYDKAQQTAIELMQARARGDSRTNVMAEVAFSLGDCRPSAYIKQLLFDVWKLGNLNHMMREAFEALRRSDDKRFADLMEEIKDFQKRQLYVFDFIVRGAFQMTGKYEFVRDEQGRLLIAASVADLEDHTLNALVELGDDGRIANLTLRDSFYHEVYSFENLPVDPNGILGSGLEAGFAAAYDAQKRRHEVQLYLVPTGYAGKRDKTNPDERGQFRFTGHTVRQPAREAFLLGGRSAAVQDFLKQLVGET